MQLSLAEREELAAPVYQRCCIESALIQLYCAVTHYCNELRTHYELPLLAHRETDTLAFVQCDTSQVVEISELQRILSSDDTWLSKILNAPHTILDISLEKKTTNTSTNQTILPANIIPLTETTSDSQYIDIPTIKDYLFKFQELIARQRANLIEY